MANRNDGHPSCNHGLKHNTSSADLHWLAPRRKISRYIADISCIEKGRHDISWRNTGPAIFREKSLKIDDISRYIGDFHDISQYISDFHDILHIFPDISHGQRGSTEVKGATVKSMRYSASRQTHPCYIICIIYIYI